ncbi:DUF3800 domain-containing protein [Stenotrophomonas maltophilia]|uniref:DUF3800 domain-containing protein n=1 Tax=Stenotrophomonas maltophilia TaxID=40324 RepID=UPI000C148EBE|nr:DUF3800 domain-containing protein [Stenotrophomonas maltophilia]HDX0800646.1 DUF3800 domain-containing protein [Stenotrophomonas maltophilia]HDX0815326.1 DUF3800 domain-containing protein [Stenotrophomonas maltophilia]HDX0823022.1 DUF3800 domain-containing protein [Stenotrophomonas maltophilia]HDX0842566.1 DUF3800 domain-containing protein [Stenotrophomonas maltophilia]HDX0849677.1 DUF3800 domain-containing protein [Stenotrophomonas maltophilia]
MHAFNVYIDESGDEGFQFRDNNRGSSRWFVLSAAITRADTDLETVKLVDRVRTQLGKPARADLHFRKLNHGQRLPYLAEISGAPLRTVSVLVHKPSLQSDAYSEKGLLYNYATRLLLERVSWLCRDARRDAQHKAKLVFSNRSNMSYAELCAYLARLQQRRDVRIDWSAVDCQNVAIFEHSKRMGLQIADAVASAVWSSVNPNGYGFTEPRYAEMLRRTMYRHKGARFGYGLKVLPAEIIANNPPPGAEWLQGADWA